MAQKNNIRSIRFSDELAELIDRQQGQTFTQKFENLITWLPRKEEQLQQIQERIRQEQERLFQLQKASEELRMLERDIQSARHYFGIVERRAKAISEKFEES